MKTFENIDIGDYRLFDIFFALPFAVLIESYFFILRLTCRIVDLDDIRLIPEKALIVTYHGESYVDLVCLKFLKKLVESRDFYWLGFHGFLSYLGVFTTFLVRARCFRFNTKRKTRPLDQVLNFLNANPGISLALRTDAGGPYWKVRRSLLAMASAGERPLIGVRFAVNRKIVIRRHYIPLPFSKITIQLRPVIHYSDIKDLSEEDALNKITKMMGETEF